RSTQRPSGVSPVMENIMANVSISSVMDYVIRQLPIEDELTLWEMLYHGLSSPGKKQLPPREIVRRPEFARHVEGWGRSGDTAVDQLIPWLLDEDQQLRGVPFSEVIFDTTGKKMLPFDASNPVDQRVAKAISAACDETIKKLNAPGSAIQHIDRINEVSSHFENSLRELLNATPGVHCAFPLTNDGKPQRSGYPDLRIVDIDSKRV